MNIKRRFVIVGKSFVSVIFYLTVYFFDNFYIARKIYRFQFFQILVSNAFFFYFSCMQIMAINCFLQ